MIRQLPLEVLDDIMFVPRIVLAMPIEAFATKFGFELGNGCDDLDYFQGIALSLNGGVPFTLTHHRGHKAGETTLSLPIQYGDAATISALFKQIANELDIDAKAVMWLQDYDDPPRLYA